MDPQGKELDLKLPLYARFDVFDHLSVPLTEFQKLNFAFNALAVFAGIIIIPLTDAAAQFDEFFFLRHGVPRIR